MADETPRPDTAPPPAGSDAERGGPPKFQPVLVAALIAAIILAIAIGAFWTSF